MAKPDHFPFPFEPYDIQEKFMRSLYTVLEDKKLGIFESPTGTVCALRFPSQSCAWQLLPPSVVCRESHWVWYVVLSNGSKTTKKVNGKEYSSFWVESCLKGRKKEMQVCNLICVCACVHACVTRLGPSHVYMCVHTLPTKLLSNQFVSEIILSKICFFYLQKVC